MPNQSSQFKQTQPLPHQEQHIVPALLLPSNSQQQLESPSSTGAGVQVETHFYDDSDSDSEMYDTDLSESTCPSDFDSDEVDSDADSDTDISEPEDDPEPEEEEEPVLVLTPEDLAALAHFNIADAWNELEEALNAPPDLTWIPPLSGTSHYYSPLIHATVQHHPVPPLQEHIVDLLVSELDEF